MITDHVNGVPPDMKAALAGPEEFQFMEGI